MLKKVPQRRRKCGWNPIVVLVDKPVLCIVSHRCSHLLWENLLDVLVAEEDLDDLFPAVLERGVFDVDIGRQEELGVPGKALARGQVRNLDVGC